MKLPKPRKLSSGNWFIQLRLDGESVPVTERTEKECIAAARLIKAEYKAGKREKEEIEEITLRQAINNYIDSRSNTLSPSTIRGYNTIRDNRFRDTMDKRIIEIKDWQTICNKEAKICSPKTLRNSWRLMASVLRFSDKAVPRVNLPQVVIKERSYLEPEQIPIFIKAVKEQRCEIPALLALHSLRRSEICALTWKDVDLAKQRIKVSGAAIYNENQKLVQRKSNKNQSSQRYVPIMIPELIDALKKCPDKDGLIITCSPNTIWRQINHACRLNELPEVGVHGLRHSFASLAYHLGVPEKIAMQIGGWSDYNTMRKIYTHLAQKDVDKYGSELIKFFNNANDNANKTQ